MKWIIILAYLSVIVLANVLTASFAPIHFGDFLIPLGTFLIGITFILRDAVQNIIGRKYTYATIFLAMTLSAATSTILDDTLWIVFASAITFLFSETADTEVYSRLKMPQSFRVLYSGLVGGILDSVLFVIIGLSPLGAGFIPWEFVGMAILGQIFVKSVIQFIGATVVWFALKLRLAVDDENSNA